MRIAGVRLKDGRAVWVDAGALWVAPLDRATTEVDGNIRDGEVFVTPDQMVSPPDRMDGVLVRSEAPLAVKDDCDHVPGADLPALGQLVRWGEIHGTVVALHPLEVRATIQHDGGAQTEVPLNEISHE